MLPRRLSERVVHALSRYPAVALLGPRQVGKTTIARTRIAPALADRRVEYLDLENPSDLAKLSDPLGYLQSRNDRLLIIDEVQRAPDLFTVLRSVIDERMIDGRPHGHFLLLGSASIDLLRQSSESLAGRIAHLELCPLDVLETESVPDNELWIRGGFPRSLLAADDEGSADWRANFITTYLERDIPLIGPRVPAETLRRFWTMLAHRQGAPMNAAELSRGLGVDAKTVAAYLDLMVDLLLVRRLTPLHANVRKRLVKAPKTYVRDSGLVHTLLRLDTLDDVLGHPVVGASWEGHVIENLLRVVPPRTDASYYRTSTGNEIDLVLDLPGGQRWAIEVKRSSAPTVSQGFHAALEDVQPNAAFIVYAGRERYPKGDGIEAIGLLELATRLDGLRGGA